MMAIFSKAFLSKEENRLRLTMVVSYLLAFGFYSMMLVDMLFSLSGPSVVIDVRIADLYVSYSFGYGIYYAAIGYLFWLLMKASSNRLDEFERQQRLLPTVIETF